MQEIVLGNEQARLGERLGGGNEGDVFSLKGDPSRSIKIYKHYKRQTRAEKIRAVVSANLGQKNSLVAFPLQVATSNSGEFLGFSMRLMSDRREIQQLYNPKSRLHHYPKVDYRFLVRVAQNVARAVGTVQSLEGSASQSAACVIGDLNHSGLLVANDATVALINADRFQYKVNDKIYPQVSGLPEFMPPELHKNRFKNTLLTHTHTNFGLAVIIFHLLFMGRHPYAGRYTGPIVPLGEAIARNQFAYSVTRQYETKTAPPLGALSLRLFPDTISNNFEKAFGLAFDKRPSPADWISALSSFESSLSKCTKVSTHYHPAESKDCAWCNLKENGSIDMFPSLSVDESNSPIKAETESRSSSLKAKGVGLDQNLPSSTNKGVEGSVAIQHDEVTNNFHCPRCKKINESKSSFCYSCGLPLSDRANPEPMTGKTELSAKNNGCFGRLISAVINIVIALFVIFIILSLLRAILMEI